MEQLTDQMIQEMLVQEHTKDVVGAMYTVPIVVAILVIICIVLFVKAKRGTIKNSDKGTNKVIARIAVIVAIVATIVGALFLSFGIQDKKDGVETDWYVSVRKVKEAHYYHFSRTREYRIRIEGDDNEKKTDSKHYTKYAAYNNAKYNKPEVYVICNKKRQNYAMV